MISFRYGLFLAGAFTVGAWLARTEMGAYVRSTPPHETAQVVFASIATFLEGRMPKSMLRPDYSERVAEFRPDEPLRRIAASFGMLVLETRNGKELWVKRCTAAIVAPTQIVTNHHCLVTKPGEIVDSVTLWLDFVDTQAATRIAVDPKPAEQDQVLDYALLMLKEPVNPATHVLPRVTFRAALPGERLLLVHHRGGEVKAVTRFRCRVATEELAKDELAHTCTASPGSSGALLLAERDHAIVGLHRSVAKPDRTYVGYATPAMRLLAKSPALQRISRQSPR